jgi:ABC transport system ATP-binding/permease protein
VPKRSFLENFLFPARTHFTKAGRLSGGEQNRLQLALALCRPSNLLILDEPTNDLDIATLQVLEGALADFPGCVVVVSHDRFFLDRVANSILAFGPDGRVRQYPGNYSDYLAAGEAAATEAARNQAGEEKSAAPSPARKKVSLSYLEKKEWEGMEAAIAAKEAELHAAEKALMEGSAQGSFADVREANRKYEGLKGEVDSLYARWEWLSDKKDKGQEA